VRSYEAASSRGQWRRVLSSVWLPWAICVLLLAGLAVAALVTRDNGRSGTPVSAATLNGQQSMTTTSAQAIRRNLNHGLRELAGLARTLPPQRVFNGERLRPLLDGLRDQHHRYRSLYVTDRHGDVVAEVGARRHPMVLPARVTRPGIAHGVDASGRQVIAWYAPLSGPKGARWTLAGEYDVKELEDSLRRAEPASAWIVDEDGRALHSPTRAVTYSVQDHAVLQRAAALASEAAGYEVEQGSEIPEVVSWAPVEGAGPAGSLGLGVVSSRPLNELDVPPAPGD
jgi:hypothetical protein